MRRKLLLLLCTFLCTIFCTASFAQAKRVTGTVSDEKGTTLPGATVRSKSSNLITKTDADGKFSLDLPDSVKVLIVTFVGMTDQEVSVRGSNLSITMKSAAVALNDVVVIGYGLSKRANLTSAISSVTEKDIKNLPVAGADQMLQGKVAGVSVTNNSGQPGGGVSVRVRGITNVTGNNEPLYVIDGVIIYASTSSTSQDQLGGVSGQTTQSPLATLNPSDILSIDILKDASAQAIYGSLAANGVVLISTKKGKGGEGKLNYDVYTGWQQVQKRLPLMNLQQYAQYYNSVVGEGTVTGLDSIPEFKNPSILGKGTDWQDAIFQTGFMQNHQLSFSGGQGKTVYYLSGNYFDQTGTVIGSSFKRYALRASIDQQVKTWLKAGVSLNLSRTNQRITLTDGQESVISLMMYNSPATPVKDANGEYISTTPIAGVAFGNSLNPVALAKLRDVRVVQSKGYGNVYVEAQVAKDFTFRNQLNFDFQLNQNSAFQPQISNDLGVTIIGPSRLREDRSNNGYWSLQDYLTYNHSFGKHYLNVVGGHESSYSHYDNIYTSAYTLTQNMQSIGAGTIDDSQTGSYKSTSALESFFGRLNYSFDSRYGLSASLRRDGSSNFGPNHRWGTFSSVSGGWTITNERFASNLKFVNFLKLRLGYGQVGSQNTNGNSLYSTSIRLVPSINGLFGQTNVAGVPANVGNPNLKWAAVETYNAGVDATLFNKKIELTVDVYKKVTTDMLLATVLPSFAGLDPNPTANSYKEIEPPTTNAGRMTNTGVDVSVTSYNIESGGFTWKTNYIFSRYKNVLNKLNTAQATLVGKSADFSPVTLTITKPGQAVGGFYGYVTDGLYRTMDELTKGPVTPLAVGPTGTYLGDIRYKDLDGNDTINSKDQRTIGNPNPKFTYSMTNTFSYKNFDLSIFLTGVYGSQIYNYSRMQTEADYNVYQNQLTTVLDRYTSTNTNGSLPRYNQWNSNNLYVSDRYIESGSYLRIQNIALGYNIPKKVLSRAKISSVRVYVSAQNVHTFTKYSGYDPELGSYNGSILNMNIDYGHYPNPRTYTVGANIEF